MATLVLTAVGQAIGGPIGGAIGSIIGQYVDQTIIFAPKARHGPRLGDLSVQTSSYGTPIPKVFGSMRVAGTVIWSTDLIESRSTSGGGKGRPKTVNYLYSASFAVALSARPIRSIGRIWADGKLLRGAAGDFKAATTFRLHGGDEDQAADPLIASAEGVQQTPAFRGIAYAMFEDLQLADFGNRIPSLTFEVEADPEPVTIGAIAEELSERAVSAGSTPVLTGFTATGDSLRSAIAALADLAPMSLADRDGVLRMGVEPAASASLASGEESGRREIVRRAASSVPHDVSIVYYEVERDYQTGLQRATVDGVGAGRSADRLAVPAALTSDRAKMLAELRLASLRAGRTTGKLRLPWSRMALRPGDGVAIDGEQGSWRIRRWTLGPAFLELEVQRRAGAPLPGAATANPGRPVRQPDLVHGPTVLRVFDLPLAEATGARPMLFAAAAGTEPGWRRAELLASFDGGWSWTQVGASAAPAVVGIAASVLAAAGSTLFDTSSTLDVDLLHEGMWLENASDRALAGNANFAIVGRELVQFGHAEWLGGRRFRLSRFLRGRRGTEWAAGIHAAGEDFTLIEAAALTTIEAPAGFTGGELRLSAAGVGDESVPATAVITVEGETLRPPSPVHLRAERLSDGDIALSWVRRSRQGWSWTGGSDTPLAEESESYRLRIAGAGFERIAATDGPTYRYTAAQQASDGAAGPLQISVVQLGTFGASRPAALSLI